MKNNSENHYVQFMKIENNKKYTYSKRFFNT